MKNKTNKSKRKSLSIFDSKLDSQSNIGFDYENNETKTFNLRQDTLFVEDNQTVVENFSDIIKPLSPHKVTDKKVKPGTYIVEITNKNPQVGALKISISLVEDLFSKKYYSVLSMEAFQKFFTFDEEKTIHVSIHADLNVAVDYSAYIYEVTPDDDDNDLDIFKK